MDIIRSIGRFFCIVIFGASIGAWIVAATAYTTIFNAQTVKQWLSDSGVYNSALLSVVRIDESQTRGLLTQPAFEAALSSTFTAQYVQTGVETVIDAIYNVLHGKTNIPSFVIPVEQKRDEFRNNLAVAIEGRIAALPTCTTQAAMLAEVPACIPPRVTAAEYARQLAHASGEGRFLQEPITHSSVFPQSFWANIVAAQTVATAVGMAVWVLPIIIIVSATTAVLLHARRLRGLAVVGRQAVVLSVLPFMGGLALWLWGAQVNADTWVDMQDEAVVLAVINPLLHTILPNIGAVIAALSGLVAALGVITWIVAAVLIKKRASRPEMPFKSDSFGVSPQDNQRQTK